jgi:broad specificity phosphatase PhoE
MKRLVVTLVLIAAASVASGQQTIILVRHAEKATDANEASVPLSEAGRARATRLAQMLATAGVTAIYATETDRARQTAEPLAKALKLEMRTYSPRDATGKLSPQILLDRLKRDNASGTVFWWPTTSTVPEASSLFNRSSRICAESFPVASLGEYVRTPSLSAFARGSAVCRARSVSVA